MFCHAFPDLQWLKSQAESRFSNQIAMNGEVLHHTGWPTVVLNVKAEDVYRDNIPGPFSLFTTLAGDSVVEVNGRRTSVPQEYFFLTNAGQRYTLEIEKRKPAETFNIHFGEKWAEGVFASLVNDTDTLLDLTDKGDALSVHFYARLYAKDEMITSILTSIKETRNDGRLRREELLYQLLVHLLRLNKMVRESSLNIPVVKSSSREEILKRLFLATDYIYANYSTDVSLDELARVSCLSKFHFLRLFKLMFRQTPHQFVSAIRIEKAKRILQTGRLDVKTVASQTGFDNASSFSRMFRNQTGVSPNQYRQAC